MWTRKELKLRAKEALKRNYWRIVLVAFLAVMLGGGISAAASAGGGGTSESGKQQIKTGVVTDDMGISIYENTPETVDNIADEDNVDAIAENMDAAEQETSGTPFEDAFVIGGLIFVIVIVALCVFALAYALAALLYNPFYTGVCRFMLYSVDDRAEVKEIAYGFDHSYKNVVKTMFHADLRVLAWSLLFIIPGIYKKYQYRMVAYILAEHPDIDYKEALRLSSDIMNGEKWHTFVLDLSFIPWRMLGMITCGIVGVFYVNPYIYLTNAALYRELSERRDNDGI